MKTPVLAVALACSALLVACDEKPAAPAPAVVMPAPEPAAPAVPIAEPSTPPESAEAAAGVVETYFARIVARDYAGAYALQRNPPQSLVDFAQGFAKYEKYNATVGAPGLMDGAAGSIFIEVPILINGRLKTGETVNELGRVTLRRVNNVDGATPEQLLWRIQSIETTPTAASGVANG